MSLKNPKRTAQRIIAMVESGDYDPEIIEHMVESLVVGRDRKIKHMITKKETAEKPFDMVIAHSRIVGALRNTITEHGDITMKLVGSAAKRIEGNLKQVEQVDPVQSSAERLENGKVTIVRDKNSTHKLTVARDGNIRIKIAIGADIFETNEIIEKFTTAGVEAIQLNKGTLRGKLKLGEIFEPYCKSISMLTDSKTEKVNLQF